MGNAVLCTADDGQPAAYMITDMVEGGNTLVCAAHWVDLCLSVAQAAAEGQLDVPQVPQPTEPASETGPEPGLATEPEPGPADPGPPAGRSPDGPSGDDTAGDGDPGPRGFGPATIAAALDDGEPAPDRLLHARSSPGKRPRRSGQPRNG